MDTTTQTALTKVSYAQMTQETQFPTKEQAIILDNAEGISIQECITAIGKMIEPRRIRFVSRISHERVCLYLDSKRTADKFTDNYTKINIGTHTLEIRPLLTKLKRIILSDVCPIIPHDVILTELAKLNIKPVSQITFIMAGMKDPDYTHISSFSRQMYLRMEDVVKLPESLQIDYEDTVNWIYPSIERLSQFLCKEEDHLETFCENIDNLLQNSPNILNSADTRIHLPNAVQLQITDAKTPQGTKRPASSSISVENSQETNNTVEAIKKLRKCLKETISIEKIISHLQPENDYIVANVQRFPLDIEGIKQFLTDSYLIFDRFLGEDTFLSSENNIKLTAMKYTKDILALISMLSEIEERLSEQMVKGFIKWIINFLKLKDIADASSDSSITVKDPKPMLHDTNTKRVKILPLPTTNMNNQP